MTPTDDAPVATDDAVTAHSGVAVVVEALDNDTDPDGDDLQIVSVGQGENGSVQINDDGTLTYTSNDGFAGTDSFSYTVSDGNGGTDTASVTVEVAGTSPLTPVFDLSGPHQFSGRSGRCHQPAAQRRSRNRRGDHRLLLHRRQCRRQAGADRQGCPEAMPATATTCRSISTEGVLKARFQDGQSDTALTFGGLKRRPGI